jgi:hypothetical protein
VIGHSAVSIARHYPAVVAYKLLIDVGPRFWQRGQNRMRTPNHLSICAALAILITLTAGPSSAAAEGAKANRAFSRDFLGAMIEERDAIREWHSALASAVGTKYALTPQGLGPYQARAMTNLRLALAAAKTDADQDAAPLILNEYQKMEQLSDKYLAKRAILSYIELGALQDDELDQSVIACEKSLEAMAASGQFMEDEGCH